MSELDARFFTINFNPEYFADMRDLLVQKIEKVIGKKLKTHDDIYYFHLTKIQLKSRNLVRLVDDLYNFLCIDNLICI